MRRALQLARMGRGFASPNPMVGAVIVRRGLIIGEGYHRRCGAPHAEVNAVRSVKDPALLRDSTIYVTLEPCAHYGKTPPCAKLIIDCGIPRVVIGCTDPFAKVSGRGIAMLREAGVEVVTGVLEDECLALNRVFMTAHTLRRPYVLLKWAMSADGFTDRHRSPGESPALFSSAITSQQVHLLRSRFDAIMVGGGTVAADMPRLDVRRISGRAPLPVVLDRRGIAPASAPLFLTPGCLCFSDAPRTDLPGTTELLAARGIPDVLAELYRRGVTSLMVEGGPILLREFLTCGLWDEARVEIAPFALGAEGTGHMDLPEGTLGFERLDGRTIVTVCR